MAIYRSMMIDLDSRAPSDARNKTDSTDLTVHRQVASMTSSKDQVFGASAGGSSSVELSMPGAPGAPHRTHGSRPLPAAWKEI